MAERGGKKSKKPRHDPLGQQILADAAPKVRRRKGAGEERTDSNEDMGEKVAI
jgi:hypothetical protein